VFDDACKSVVQRADFAAAQELDLFCQMNEVELPY
jgi:hypothetical protein